MTEWSDYLVRKLSTGGHALRELVGLENGLDGPEFERRLGQFLALAEAFPDLERILGPSTQQMAVQGLNLETLRNWHRTTQRQFDDAIGVVHQSMIENFGWERINPDAARAAYEALFNALGVNSGSRLVYATTNYDHIGEAVLDRLGRRPDSGVRERFSEPGVSSARHLDMENLTEVVGRYTPVLHLHGAVGWFDQPGHGPTVVNTTSYDPTWGVPIVMLPSLEKDYQQSTTIETIWIEFRRALQRAKRVLVLGHSLADVELVSALAEDVHPYHRIGFTELPGSEPGVFARQVWAQLTGSRRFAVRFSTEFNAAGAGFEEWDEVIEQAASEQNS
jgi:hypothetical protein